MNFAMEQSDVNHLTIRFSSHHTHSLQQVFAQMHCNIIHLFHIILVAPYGTKTERGEHLLYNTWMTLQKNPTASILDLPSTTVIQKNSM